MKPLTVCSLGVCLAAVAVFAMRTSPSALGFDEAPPPPDAEASADAATPQRTTVVESADDEERDESDDRDRPVIDRDEQRDRDTDREEDDDREEYKEEEIREVREHESAEHRERSGRRGPLTERRLRIETDPNGRNRYVEEIIAVDRSFDDRGDAFGQETRGPSDPADSRRGVRRNPFIERRIVRDITDAPRDMDVHVRRNEQNPSKPDPRQAALQRLHSVRERLARGENEEAQQEALRDALNDYFEVDLQERERQLDAIRKKLQMMEEKLETRRQSQQEVVDLQYRLLVNEVKGLGFFAPGDSARRRPLSTDPFGPPAGSPNPFGGPAREPRPRLDPAPDELEVTAPAPRVAPPQPAPPRDRPRR